jgi:hypothetical protein
VLEDSTEERLAGPSGMSGLASIEMIGGIALCLGGAPNDVVMNL